MRVTLRLHGELNDFVPPVQRDREIVRGLARRANVKDLIESVGVPHPEVGSVLVDDVPEGLSYVVSGSARIAVFPAHRSQPTPLRFVADGHLGRLATYLRALGLDTLYDRRAGDEWLARVSHDEGRVLLTRDVGLLKRSLVVYGRWVRATSPSEQLAEIASHYELGPDQRPFTRCVVCNALLEPRPKPAVLSRVPPRSLEAFDEFFECVGCARVYWRGTHHDALIRLFSGCGIRTHERPPGGVDFPKER